MIKVVLYCQDQRHEYCFEDTQLVVLPVPTVPGLDKVRFVDPKTNLETKNIYKKMGTAELPSTIATVYECETDNCCADVEFFRKNAVSCSEA